MILILSNENDLSTCEVLEWITYFGCKYIRLNETDNVYFKKLKIENKQTSILVENQDNDINLSDFSSYWYRRGSFNLSNFKWELPIQNDLINHLYKERFFLLDYIYSTLDSIHGLGCFNTSTSSKLKSLHCASICELIIPQTNIVVNKKQVEQIFLEGNSLITKCIQDMPQFKVDGKLCFLYTEELDNLKISELSDEFAPSIVQNKIDKKYELRIFYINKKCYSMAIFSQNDEKTAIDFRKYNLSRPNRSIPYKLPKEIEIKIIKFMKYMNLDTGSIDMIYTPNKEYVFLEVNPIGQFGMVSTPCNYLLEKKIARYLVNY
ncbi:MAG: grasp-with-spasm system ATP-grasp peptide maturase [Bacteroidota bacterium]